jgi:hypothetical protein
MQIDFIVRDIPKNDLFYRATDFKCRAFLAFNDPTIEYYLLKFFNGYAVDLETFKRFDLLIDSHISAKWKKYKREYKKDDAFFVYFDYKELFVYA